MAITNIAANPSGTAQCSSPYSNTHFWSAGTGNVAVTIPAGGGSTWVVWQIQAAIPPGQPFNGIQIQGTDDFLVGGGGVGMTRAAEHRVLLTKVFPTDFFDAYGSPIANVAGSGAGVNVNVVVTNPAITSTDIVNGTCYLGFLVGSNADNIGAGAGAFRSSVLGWTAYTGPDVPSPPVGTASGYLINPAFNTNGISVPGFFQSIEAVITPVNNNDPSVVAQWILPTAGMTFAVNNQQSYNPPVSFAQGWRISCGQINVAGSVAPGTYSINCTVGVFPGPQSFMLVAQLVVAPPSGSGWFFEV